jgi:CheY-like chemotaxis protein
MGGSVIVTSELKQGSVFQLRLPDVSVSRCLPASEQPVRTMAADFNRLRQATVLGVDDNETNRQLLQAMLGGSHHRLLLASNGWEAIEMALDAKPDLILLDLRMPKMDGRNVLRALHDIQSLQLTPVIAVTASSLPADQADIASWFNGCLQKPFSSRELFDEMARFLPRFQKELAPLDQPAATEQAPSHWASDFTPDKMKSSGGEKGQLSSALTHDIKSSLAGVVMSAELLLGQAACLNDEAARRLVNEILVPGRLILAWVKNFSEGAAAQGAPAPGSKAQSGQARAMSPDAFRAHCTHMRADAEALRGQITQRAERRSVVLAENIIRSCTELSNAVEKLSAHCSAIKKSRPILPDHSEAAARAAERYRQRSHNKQTRLLTLTYAAHGLSGC